MSHELLHLSYLHKFIQFKKYIFLEVTQLLEVLSIGLDSLTLWSEKSGYKNTHVLLDILRV